MKLEWKREGPDVWSARVLPNPQGLELEIEGIEEEPPLRWRAWATTTNEVDTIVGGQADTVDAAKAAAEAWAREHLLGLRAAVTDAMTGVPGLGAKLRAIFDGPGFGVDAFLEEEPVAATLPPEVADHLQAVREHLASFLADESPETERLLHDADALLQRYAPTERPAAAEPADDEAMPWEAVSR